MIMESIKPVFQSARTASRRLALRSDEEICGIINAVADATLDNISGILAANSSDMDRMEPENPKRDRLLLTEERIRDIVSDMRAVASLPSPLGITLMSSERPNGLRIDKITVPFGVIGIVYEARPNVTFDVFSLCLKAGSACVLKGGSDASATNGFVVSMMRDVLEKNGWDCNCVNLLDGGHEATGALLGAVGLVDLIIPRGSKGLIDYVRDNAKVPVIETGAGVCHTYVHESADTAMARDIVFNAKTRRVSVCNALDCLVVDRSRLESLPEICGKLAEKRVMIFADEDSYAALEGRYPYLNHAVDEDFGREWLDYKMSIATVDGLRDGIEFVSNHTSHHSEAIIAEDEAAQNAFLKEIDAACVYVNASTAFTDGGQFGFGAEIGISTQKLHARGPMALPEITTYKYVVRGNGQVR